MNGTNYEVPHCGGFSTSHSHPSWAQIFAPEPKLLNLFNAVIPTAQTNKGIRSALMLIGLILIIVEIKFTAPRIADTPAK